MGKMFKQNPRSGSHVQCQRSTDLVNVHAGGGVLPVPKSMATAQLISAMAVFAVCCW